MKLILKTAAFLFAGVAIISSPAMAVATSNGDLMIGFYQVVGGSVQANSYVFNLGAASLYRENTQTGVSVSTINPGIVSSNIGADLATTFGTDWANSGTVYWTIYGGADQSTSGLLNGDVARTSYITVPMGVSAPAISGVPRGTVSNSIEAIRVGSNGTGTAGANVRGSIIPIVGNTTLDEFFPPATPSQLGIGSELRGLFGSETGTYEGALDLYRYVHSTASGDLTSGLGSGNAVLGTGQYIGTITIDGNGNLSVIPEPSAMLLGAVGAFAGLSRRTRKPQNV